MQAHAVPEQRRRVLYSGRVQGVGFRFNAVDCSQPHEVTGFVRNLPDRCVELVAEGEAPVLDAFLDAIDHSMARNIQTKTIDIQPATREFSSFAIRY